MLLAQAQDAARSQFQNGGGICHFHIIQLDGAGREMLLAENAIGFFHLETFSNRKETRARAFMPTGRTAISTSGKSAAAKSLLENGFPSQNARHPQRRNHDSGP